MKPLICALNILASIAVIVIGIQSMDSFSLGAVGFLVWAISPYIFAIFMINRSTQHMAIMTVFGLSLVIAIGGIYLLIDAMYIHPNAQGALAFVVIPMYQWGLLLISVLPLYMMHKKTTNNT